jgi:hypothetical protein
VVGVEYVSLSGTHRAAEAVAEEAAPTEIPGAPDDAEAKKPTE